MTAAVTAALLKKAQDDATAAVEKVTTLRGTSARKVAHAVLAASGDSLRAEQTIRLGAGPDRGGLVGLAVLLSVDLALYVAAATGRNPRGLRLIAGAAVIGRVGLAGYAQYRARSMRERINAGLAAGGLT